MEEMSSRSHSNIDPGYILAQGRLKAKMTTEQVANKLHLSPRKVSALENNDFKELPEAPYVRGYMRNYAQLVGVSPEPLLEAYNKITGVKKQPEVTATPARGKKAFDDPGIVKMVAAVASVAVVALIIYLWPEHDNKMGESASYDADSAESGEFLTENIMGSGQFPLGVDGATEGGPGAGGAGANYDSSNLNSMEVTIPRAANGVAKSGPAPAVSSNVFAKNQNPIISNSVSPVEQTPVETRSRVRVPDTTTTAPVVLANKSEIVLYIEEDSWADIRDAGNNKLIYETITSGRVVTLEGVPPFKVFLGNAKGVKLFYNGNEYDVSRHQRGLVARFQLGKAGQ